MKKEMGSLIYRAPKPWPQAAETVALEQGLKPEEAAIVGAEEVGEVLLAKPGVSKGPGISRLWFLGLGGAHHQRARPAKAAVSGNLSGANSNSRRFVSKALKIHSLWDLLFLQRWFC